MTCRRATELHTQAAEGALRGQEKLRYGLHMRVCGPCQRYRGQLETTVDVLKQLPAEEPPADLVEALAAEIEKKA